MNTLKHNNCLAVSGRIRNTVVGLCLGLCLTAPAADDRVSWDNGGSGSDFTDRFNWNTLDATVPDRNQLPGYRAWTGGNRNAIIQGAFANPVLSSDFTPDFYFNPLIVRSGASLTINAGTLNIPFTQFEAGQGGGGSVGTVTQNGGNVLASTLYVTQNNGTDYNMNGGEMTIVTLNGNGTSGFGTGNFNFGPGGNGVGVELTVSGSARIDNFNNNVFTVGSGSILSLGDAGADHIFADGLTAAAGGTLATGSNSVADPTIATGMLTLESGTSIDYSINGEAIDADTWTTNGGLTLDATDTYNLIVDVVAGDVKQSAGPFTIFDTTSGGLTVNGGTFDQITWNIIGAEGTRVATLGSVVNDGGLIRLDGFEAFSIPEPSTGVLFGLGALAMLFRRRMQK